MRSPNGAEYFSWALSHAEKGKHLTFLCVSQSYQHLPFHHLGQQIFPNLRVKQKSLTHKQSRYSNITFWILLAPGGLVAESTEGSYLAPLLSFLSAQKGWQGVACQGRLPTAEISCTAVEINNYWACLVPITPFPWLCFALVAEVSCSAIYLCREAPRIAEYTPGLFHLSSRAHVFFWKDTDHMCRMFGAVWLVPPSLDMLGFFWYDLLRITKAMAWLHTWGFTMPEMAFPMSS